MASRVSPVKRRTFLRFFFVDLLVFYNSLTALDSRRQLIYENLVQNHILLALNNLLENLNVFSQSVHLLDFLYTVQGQIYSDLVQLQGLSVVPVLDCLHSVVKKSVLCRCPYSQQSTAQLQQKPVNSVQLLCIC